MRRYWPLARTVVEVVALAAAAVVLYAIRPQLKPVTEVTDLWQFIQDSTVKETDWSGEPHVVLSHPLFGKENLKFTAVPQDVAVSVYRGEHDGKPYKDYLVKVRFTDFLSAGVDATYKGKRYFYMVAVEFVVGEGSVRNIPHSWNQIRPFVEYLMQKMEKNEPVEIIGAFSGIGSVGNYDYTYTIRIDKLDGKAPLDY